MKTQIPGYRIQRELGKGGMAVVYLATREVDNLQVALKVLPPNLLTPVSARRFQREGHSLKVLDHPHIIKVYEVGARDGYHFIAMEYVKGRALSRCIADHTHGLPTTDAVRFAREIATALAAIHVRGMIHRDLKPANIMLTDDGTTRLLDFGLVQLDGLTMLTATGNIVGTPTYMSPEQCAGLPLDHRTDIYAFGVLLFELLTGKPPFRSESVYDILEQQRNEPPPVPSTLRPDLPSSLEQVTLWCLEKAPEDRPPSMTEVLAHLGPGADSSAPVGAREETQRIAPPRVRTRVAFAMSLLALMATTAWLFSPFPHATALRSNVVDRLEEWIQPPSSSDLREEVQERYRALSRAEAYYSVGRRHEAEGRLERAFRYYRRAARTFAEKPEYLHALIALSHQLGKRAEVVPLVKRYVDLYDADDPKGTLRQWLEATP